MVEENQRMVEVNRQTLEEMKAGREAQERPFVVIEIDYEHPPMLYVLIRNLGRGPALSVTFTFLPELVTPEAAMPHGSDGLEGLSSHWLPMFTKGIDLLPQGARISLWWGAEHFIVKHFYEENLERSGIQVKIFYESLDGTRYSEEANLNPTGMEPALMFQPPSLSRLVNPVVEAAKKIDKAIDMHGYLKVKTATERKFEEKAMWESTMQQAKWTRRQIEEQQRERTQRPEEDES